MSSPRIGLSYLAPQQAQKHVTVNETFRRLDALVQLAAASASLAAEPASPAEGDIYVLPAGKTGAAWGAMADGALAFFVDAAWMEIAPKPGWRAWVEDEEALFVHDGAAWAPLSSGAAGGEGAFDTLGVNTEADATNRLAVKSDASLFSHDDVTPGSGDMRLIVNKAASGDTASALFQTDFEGRAEYGLTGDDDFHIKVSADGETWFEAIVIDKDTGEVAFPNTSLGAGGANLSFARDADSVVVLSDSGTDADLPAATTSLAGVISAADKTKLDGVEAGATANAADADLRDRATHTGAQAIATVTGLEAALDGKQAAHARLADIGDNLSATSGLVEKTGASTFGAVTVTAAGKALLDDADAAAQRATLGLVIGTNVQAFDAELAALAGLASAENKVPRFTGSGTADVIDFLDEDNMASNSATAVASQQSLKAYVDAFKPTEAIGIACSDETTALTTGTAKATFRMPYAFTLSAVRASVGTAPTGATLIVDINEGGTTILSTKLSIDASEKTSATAASAAVISDTALADDAEITIDIDQIGSTVAGAGLKVWLIGKRA